MSFSFKKYRDLILGVVMLLFSGFYLYFAQQIKTRPKLTPSYASAKIMPTILGILLAVLSVICIIQGVKRMKADDGVQEKKGDLADTMSVVYTFAIMIAYALILPKLGFCLSTMIYLFPQMMILAPKGKRNVKLFAIVTVIFTFVVFFIFRFGLSMLLPRGIIEALLGF